MCAVIVISQLSRLKRVRTNLIVYPDACLSWIPAKLVLVKTGEHRGMTVLVNENGPKMG